MKSETETRRVLERIELDFKYYLEDYKGQENATSHQEKIKFYEDSIRAIKFILEDDL